MTTTTDTDFVAVPHEVPRDGRGRPRVIPGSGGKPVSYTRCTTFVSAIEDPWQINAWRERHLAIGLAMRPDLLEAVGSSDLADKKGVNDLCDQAKHASGADDKALWGTYMHAVTEAADRGEDPADVPLPGMAYPPEPTDFEPDLAAYLQATQGFKYEHIESFMVQDYLKIGGTPDRIVKIGRKRYIADLKTGGVDLGSVKIAAQLAVYSRSLLYDWRAALELGNDATPEQAHALRSDPQVSMTQGIVIHLPKGEATCNLYWVDLEKGWHAVQVSGRVRGIRSLKFGDTFSTYQHPVSTGETVIDLATAISDATSHKALEDLWRANAAAWSPDLTALAKARKASLPE